METKTMSFRDTIILAMSEEMRLDENVLLMGEDVGIFGGDFGTSGGMLEEFGPERVRDCPISEAAISGAAAGAAMTGLRPIVDMTFMDFSVIAMDAIVNQAAKTRYMFGVQSFGPIINQPNSAILGVSSTIEKPVVVNGEIVIRPIMSLGLTIDHRIVDGMAGAKFMKDLKTLIEDPISMLV